MVNHLERTKLSLVFFPLTRPILKFKFVPVVFTLTFIFLNISLAEAKPKLKPSSRPQSTNQQTVYQRAKQELPDDIYAIYRIIDRLSRANKLDNHPWRIGIIDKYDMNAFATEVNLIAIYNGMLDQLGGDSSAIACIIGHEMGHHVKRHLALSPVQKVELETKIKKEAEEEVQAEINQTQSDVHDSSVGAAILGGILGSDFGLREQAVNRMEEGKQKIAEIIKQKNTLLQQKILEQERDQEFEADKVGYIYMVTAGFEPEGCIRAMEVLARIPGSEIDSEHPAVPKRIEILKYLMVEQSAQTLILEGRTNLSSTPPLSYNLSKDGQSLRVNSRYQGSAGDTIDQQFGN